MIAAFCYYVLVYPISLLPLWMIYPISDLFYVLTISVFPYRKKVITANLERSFPEKNSREIAALRRKFYCHFADLLAEGIKNLSISEKQLRKRMRVKNPELMQRLYNEGRSVLLVSGHYNNWEWMITAQALLFPHQAVGIGMPLSSKFWDKKLNSRRARYGMQIIHAGLVRDFFAEKRGLPIATLILSDQSPGDATKAYWMNFLHQPTAVLFGCEQLAHTHQHAVVFFALRKIKRGSYEIELSLLSDEPSRMLWGEITEQHTHALEALIQEAPAYWLWSHKRWKREVPKDIEQLKQQQKQRFYEKFGR